MTFDSNELFDISYEDDEDEKEDSWYCKAMTEGRVCFRDGNCLRFNSLKDDFEMCEDLIVIDDSVMVVPRSAG